MDSNFISAIRDLITDLSNTFPEYAFLWEKWTDLSLSQNVSQDLFEYCLTVYPERFFDILYQNDDIFLITSEVNTRFLPNVDFKILFNGENVSEVTKKSLWKYLQLILFTIVNKVTDKSKFGDSANMFDGIDETELHEKINAAMINLGDFFQMTDEPKNLTDDPGETTFNFDKMDNIPSADDVHGHLKGLFDGKIGSLAKELAEEITGDFADLMEDDGTIKSAQDVVKKIMKNPKKIMDLLKVVSIKLNTKMKNGDISQDDIMKEASEIMGRMKDMGGDNDFSEIFKNITKNMGPMTENKTALTRMTQQMTNQNSLKSKLEKRRHDNAKRAAIAALATNAVTSAVTSSTPNTFTLDDKQETTPIKTTPIKTKK